MASTPRPPGPAASASGRARSARSRRRARARAACGTRARPRPVGDPEVRDPERLADRRLLGLEPPRLLERHRRLGGEPFAQPRPSELIEVVRLAHPSIVPDRSAAAQRPDGEEAPDPPSRPETVPEERKDPRQLPAVVVGGRRGAGRRPVAGARKCGRETRRSRPRAGAARAASSSTGADALHLASPGRGRTRPARPGPPTRAGEDRSSSPCDSGVKLFTSASRSSAAASTANGMISRHGMPSARGLHHRRHTRGRRSWARTRSRGTCRCRGPDRVGRVGGVRVRRRERAAARRRVEREPAVAGEPRLDPRVGIVVGDGPRAVLPRSAREPDGHAGGNPEVAQHQCHRPRELLAVAELRPLEKVDERRRRSGVRRMLVVPEAADRAEPALDRDRRLVRRAAFAVRRRASVHIGLYAHNSW